MSAETKAGIVTTAAHPEHNRSIKNFALFREMLDNYDPSKVDPTISPSESMTGSNYLWVGAAAAEAIMTAVAASRLTEVTRVLDLPCGHGRVLRHLAKLFPRAQFDACDLDAAGVNFCADRFKANPIYSTEDLTALQFDNSYDIIWIGSLFTHTSAEITAKWLAFLANYLTGTGIIIATFHGRWATKMHKIQPYIDEDSWDEIIEGYHRIGYGLHDYQSSEKHDFIHGSYGLSVAKPKSIVEILETIEGTRIFSYQDGVTTTISQ
jgi:SAM-dependent methyltransferase